MITRRALDQHLAVVIAVARARNTGRRQRVILHRRPDGSPCPCHRWTISEVHSAPVEELDLAHVNPVPA